jgi:hypothetical protein
VTRSVALHHLDPTNLFKPLPVPTDHNHQALLGIRQHEPILFPLFSPPIRRDDLDGVGFSPARWCLEDSSRQGIRIHQVARGGVYSVRCEDSTDGGVFAPCGGEYVGGGFGETDGVAAVVVGVCACGTLAWLRAWSGDGRTFGDQTRGLNVGEALFGNIIHIDELRCERSAPHKTPSQATHYVPSPITKASAHHLPNEILWTHSIDTPPIRRNDRMPRSVFCARALYLFDELERSVGLQLVDPDCVCTAARRIS